MNDDKKYESLMEIGASQASVLADMVAALECDYDRLEELREELADAHADDNGDAPNSAAPFSEWLAYQAAHEDKLADLSASARELIELQEAAGECESRDDAETRIHEDALSVEMRSAWESLETWQGRDSGRGNGRVEPAEYCILLSTGGPASRIIGELDEHGYPSSARLQVQDWGTPWTDYYKTIQEDTLLAYARCFYFGQG